MPKKFTDLAELTALEDNDVVAVVDTSANTSKKITLATLRGLITPAGTMYPFAGASVPTGFLLCDGSAVSRTTYAALYAAIGTVYGTGDGSTTFNLPNSKGRVLTGRDAGQTEFDNLGETGGEKTHLLTIAEMPSHDHTTAWRPFMPSGTGSLVLNDRGGDAILVSDNAAHGSNGENLGDVSSIVNNTGGGSAHNVLQPYLVVNHIIKT